MVAGALRISSPGHRPAPPLSPRAADPGRWRVRTARRGYEPGMDADSTRPADETLVEETTDVLAEDEVVQVSPAVEELVESLEHPSTFLPDVPGWDDPPA